MHVFRVLISSMLAIETALLMDMANTQFYAYYMCALHCTRDTWSSVMCFACLPYCGDHQVFCILHSECGSRRSAL